ncbi:MAG: hypothetical protein OFPII_25540 [Osedax symbiont Rs1]|nr:MAG: hypothetical protein OFPII_25540 [Osedax symbiont Rs1]
MVLQRLTKYPLQLRFFNSFVNQYLMFCSHSEAIYSGDNHQSSRLMGLKV